MRISRAATSIAALSLLAISACGSVDSTAPAGEAASPAADGQSQSAAAGSEDVAQGAYVNVVKLTGIAWFDRMKVGVEEFAKESGQSAVQTGPSTDSPELQVGIIQGLIAKKPAGMGIVPSDPGAVDAVIGQAKSAGIKVVTHEAPQLKSPDADIEAFDNAVYGQKIMSGLGQCMQGEGEYVQFVGKLTATTHMAWANAGSAEQEKTFPKMVRIGDPVESSDNADVAYQKAKQLLQAHPKLKGFTGASSQDVPGIARAVQEAGLQEDTCVHGTGVPSETKQYLTDGSIDSIYFWDPAAAGQAVMKATQMLAEGKQLSDGMDLGVEGYTKMKQSPDNPKVFLGDAALSATKDDVDSWGF
ncbi:autoinducer 2 ABC transporter substrate-binding protein [Gephyromycinifex aptenodytis]|uniref:autoinducer 2 ABC transporter substrate-binding protein n=1 Tax=Gephyromycinifex aptenodytis TaxID=2716227 RepID=UPI001445E490|nr:autoinducer 2 ABC transporter substrate-binding protein [Gephyromycinifex aptenodytis]